MSSGVTRGVSPTIGKGLCVVSFLTRSDSGTRYYTCAYVGALLVMEKGVYTQVERQPSFDHWQCQQKADWEPGNKANLSIND